MYNNANSVVRKTLLSLLNTKTFTEKSLSHTIHSPPLKSQTTRITQKTEPTPMASGHTDIFGFIINKHLS